MTLRTGENEMGLKKIMDMSRLISMVILLLHYYVTFYSVFKANGWSHPFADRLLVNIGKMGLFDSFHTAKHISLAFLILSLLGAKGKKEERFNYRSALGWLMCGAFLYFATYGCIFFPLNPLSIASLYIIFTSLGYIFFLTGGSLLTRIIRKKLKDDIFNKINETFPQEERLLDNPYAVHFRTTYRLKQKTRQGQINLLNPFRGTLVMGNPGSGKTRWIVKPMIRQFMQKKYAMLVYDAKHPDLTRVTYGAYLQYKHLYPVEPKFYDLNFDRPTFGCNPIHVKTILDVADASEAAKTILFGLNPEWIKKQGDFWSDSAVNLLTAVIWYLRQYEEGKYCTLPHAIEVLQQPYDKLFSILRTQPEVEAYITTFVNAFLHDAAKMLEGQMASLTVSLAKLSSPNFYYVLSRNDITLDLANPEDPKILCIGSNPKKSYLYGAVGSLYLTAIKRMATEQAQQPLLFLLEEFASVYFHGIDQFLAVCRSYGVAIVMVVQDESQLSLHYGRDMANVLINIVGNIVAFQCSGSSARLLSERFGKIQQDRQSISVSGSDTSINQSRQLDHAIPQSTISSLSTGEAVGIIADNPDQIIPQKIFHGNISLEKNVLEEKLPNSEHKPSQQTLNDHFLSIKLEVKDLVQKELERMMNTPDLSHLIIRDKK